MKKQVGSICLIFMFASAALAAGPAVDDGTATLEKMRGRVDTERAREEELQLLHLDVERLKLELERKKFSLELAGLSGGGETRKPHEQAGTEPNIHVRYIAITGTRKEAVVDVDGVLKRWQEGDRCADRIIKKISATEITMVTQDGHESLLEVR